MVLNTLYLSRKIKPCFLSTHCLSPLTPAHFLWTIDMRRAWLLIKFASFITFTCMKEISTHMHKYGLSFGLGTKDIHLSFSIDCQRRWFLVTLQRESRCTEAGSVLLAVWSVSGPWSVSCDHLCVVRTQEGQLPSDQSWGKL